MCYSEKQCSILVDWRNMEHAELEVEARYEFEELLTYNELSHSMESFFQGWHEVATTVVVVSRFQV